MFYLQLCLVEAGISLVKFCDVKWPDIEYPFFLMHNLLIVGEVHSDISLVFLYPNLRWKF